MKIVSFYHMETGLLSERACFSSDEEGVLANTPADHIAIAGRFDHLSQRVDVNTGQVIDHQPVAPSGDHEWDAGSKRWILSPAAQEATDRDRAARASIAAVEGGSDRAIREALLELLPADSPARQRLQDVDNSIAAERPKLKRG